MLLEGSCHCARVRFRVHSAYPYPFNLCYCSICRKTAGGGGFAGYPDESIAEWHRRLGLEDGPGGGRQG